MGQYIFASCVVGTSNIMLCGLVFRMGGSDYTHVGFFFSTLMVGIGIFTLGGELES